MGGRVEVGDGMIVSVIVDVERLVSGWGVAPLVDTKGSYVGKATGISVAGAQEEIRMDDNRNNAMVLKKDMSVILPKEEEQKCCRRVNESRLKTLYENNKIVPL